MKKGEIQDLKLPLEKAHIHTLMKFVVGVFIFLIGASFLNAWYIISISKGGYKGLADYANLGDAIGGLSAPLINSMTGLLVYLSFSEQSRANRIQVNEIKEQKKRSEEERERSENLASFDRTTELFKEVKTYIEDFKVSIYYKNTERTDQRKGYFALEFLLEILSSKNAEFKIDEINFNEIYQDLKSILITLDFITDQINNLSTDDNYKNILSVKMFNMIYKYENTLKNIRNSIETNYSRGSSKDPDIYLLELSNLIKKFFDKADTFILPFNNRY